MRFYLDSGHLSLYASRMVSCWNRRQEGFTIDIYYISTTGCCKTSGQLWKPLTDSFLRVLLLILCSFDCQIWAIFHFGSPSPWEWIIFVENLILKKGHISGLAQIDSIDAGWILRVANFNFNYLRHFLINFKNSCGHFVANFLNFLKHPQLFQLGWLWRKLWPKIRKIRN